MQVVSVCLHYFHVFPNIIWLPWQCPLTNRKTRYRSIICTQIAFIRWKYCENQSSISGDIWLNTPVFLAASYQAFENELCQLWSYWTEVHKIFTRYRGVIYAVDMHIEVAISHSVFKYHNDEWGEFAIFSQNSLPWQCPLRYQIVVEIFKFLVDNWLGRPVCIEINQMVVDIMFNGF